MTLLARATRGYFWSQFGRLGEVVLFFLLSLVLARKMGPAAYGIFALALSLVMFCSFLAAMGIAQDTLGKFVPEAAAGRYPGGVGRLLQHLLGVRVIAVAVLSSAVLLIGRSVGGVMGVAGFAQYLGLTMLVFSLRSISELFCYVFSGLLELRVVAAGRSVVPLVALILVAEAILQGRNVSVGDALGAIAVGQLAGLLILAAAARKCLPASQSSTGEQNIHLARILSFGLFVWLSGFFSLILGDASDIMLIGWLMKDPSAVGFYSVGSSGAFRGINLLLAWLPLIGMSTGCNAYLEGGKESLLKTAEAVWKLIAISLVPPMFIVYQFSAEFVTLFYSSGYSASIPVLRILAALMAVSGLLGHGLQAGMLYILDREKIACAIFAGSAIFNVGLGIILIKNFGIVGAAWATGLSFVFFSILCRTVGNSFVFVRCPGGFLTRIVSASIVSSLTTLWLKVRSLSELAIACTLWVFVFLLFLSLVKPLSSNDSSALRQVNPALAYVAERFFARST